jgi:hypothetical protein
LTAFYDQHGHNPDSPLTDVERDRTRGVEGRFGGLLRVLHDGISPIMLRYDNDE